MPENNDIEIYDKIAHSNLSPREKGSVMKFIETMRYDRSEQTVMGAVGESSVSAIVGALLGAAHAELADGLDVDDIPADAVLWLTAELGGLVYKSPLSRDVAKSALTVFAFRKTSGFLSAVKERVRSDKEQKASEDMENREKAAEGDAVAQAAEAFDG